LTRELTKIHEEIISGPVSELLRQLADREPKGEYTLLLAPAEKEPSELGNQIYFIK